MNLNNNRLRNSIIKNNFTFMIMGILLITTIIFLIPSNTIATVFAQSSYPPAGCAHTLYISITNLPKQTDFSSMAVPMVNTGPGINHAEANYSIPGIGTAHLTINFKDSASGILLCTSIRSSRSNWTIGYISSVWS